MESFYISTANPERLVQGFEKQGFTVETLADNNLRVRGNGWEEVVVEVRRLKPGTDAAAVNEVGMNGSPPPFGFGRYGLMAT